ncbi:hypothetical protein M409DRAFT_17874 [Zasmidium cellare ATCC 36951]|uniref:Intradiol ring-cleavage dioxygenases domain-containing protein n=1 Tax=Zasmidium cellare ATCC 36951 TaxID=1080233 RepID=A0A6A6CWQ4_ZASCE|nr:uncharacterized protein M409DRAFT_17874 [Zasmidium cellare ATCC 36951]KAF2171637.1 hypothetical protein M409DRAFT_17874 [Zasmidium cellare ATCC 36951]
MAPILSLLTFGLVAINGALAHPGHDVKAEAAERAQWIQTRNPKSVRSCANNLRRRGHLDAAMVRRQQMANKVRAKRNILRRDFAEYNISHASTSDVTFGDDETLLFADDSSCVLQPEVTQGPYYVDGELIRNDMSEDQAGIPLYLDVQLIDTSSCSPVPAVFVDAWHCNATGVYSGVSASGNGNQNDTSNLDNTFLRGLQQTDINGVVQFESIFPGHYTGRAPHIHILSHNTNSTLIRTNGTILAANATTTSASHVGQIFFDQSLIAAVEANAPYNTNTQELTTNADDSILGEEAADMDPFVEYVYVNPEDITEGVLAWITLGIDPTADEGISSAATIYKDGGVANANSGMGGGPGGNGTAPSGSPPS